MLRTMLVFRWREREREVGGRKLEVVESNVNELRVGSVLCCSGEGWEGQRCKDAQGEPLLRYSYCTSISTKSMGPSKNRISIILELPPSAPSPVWFFTHFRVRHSGYAVLGTQVLFSPRYDSQGQFVSYAGVSGGVCGRFVLRTSTLIYFTKDVYLRYLEKLPSPSLRISYRSSSHCTETLLCFSTAVGKLLASVALLVELAHCERISLAGSMWAPGQ